MWTSMLIPPLCFALQATVAYPSSLNKWRCTTSTERRRNWPSWPLVPGGKTHVNDFCLFSIMECHWSESIQLLICQMSAAWHYVNPQLLTSHGCRWSNTQTDIRQHQDKYMRPHCDVYINTYNQLIMLIDAIDAYLFSYYSDISNHSPIPDSHHANFQ